MIKKIYIQTDYIVHLNSRYLIRFIFYDRTGVGSPLAGDYRNRF